MSSQHKPSRLQLAFSAHSSMNLSSAPLSSMAKATQPVRSVSQDSTDGIRKRVCKACDRCRLKKSKCDGNSPCSRCKADNAICVFGERKKSHDKVYPKGYVEMLEQQQGQLVSALQETYRRLVAVEAWSGPALSETNGHPLTHDILAALNLLESKQDGSGEREVFEDDCSRLQSKLLADGAGLVHRRGSISSESDHSQHSHPHSRESPTTSKRPVFRESFNFNSASSTPLSQSPKPLTRQQMPPSQAAAPSPLQQSSQLCNDPLFYHPDWSMPDVSDPAAIMRSRFAVQPPNTEQGLPDMDEMFANGVSDTSPLNYDANFGSFPMGSFPQQCALPYSGNLQSDFGSGFDQMDVDFNKFIQVTT